MLSCAARALGSRAWLRLDAFALRVVIRLLLLGLAFAASAPGTRVALAQPHGAEAHHASAHHGLPSAILADRRVGPYVASVWTDSDIGVGTIYVVLKAAPGSTFVPPSAVRIAVGPVSGRLPEVVHETHAERAGRGARFMTDVMFDRAERWNVRVIIEGPAGGGQLVSQVDARHNATLGPFGLVLSSLPFVLVAGVWWRATVVRHRIIAGP